MIQRIASHVARVPNLVYKAAKQADMASNAEYVRIAVCERLARDLGLDLDTLLAEQPPTRRDINTFAQSRKTLTGAGNTYEEVQ